METGFGSWPDVKLIICYWQEIVLLTLKSFFKYTIALFVGYIKLYNAWSIWIWRDLVFVLISLSLVKFLSIKDKTNSNINSSLSKLKSSVDSDRNPIPYLDVISVLIYRGFLNKCLKGKLRLSHPLKSF